MKQYFVYILASKRNGTLYLGMTNNLLRRVYEHKNKLIEGFTKKYNVHNLVYYEAYRDIYDAIAREKNIKKWKRCWKIELIEKFNPRWEDLYYRLSGQEKQKDVWIPAFAGMTRVSGKDVEAKSP